MKQLTESRFIILFLLILSMLFTGCASQNGVQPSGGALQQSLNQYENLINVRLEGATDAAVAEAFGKIVNSAPGVVAAKRYSTQIVPNEPQACFILWRATIEKTDPFRLQTNIMKMVDDVLDAGGTLVLKGVPYRYTTAEIDMLKGVRPADATSREIQFVVDRELARDREFSGRYDPYR